MFLLSELERLPLRTYLQQLEIYRSSHKDGRLDVPVAEIKSTHNSPFFRSASEKSKKHSFRNYVREHLMFERTGVEEICIYANRSQWPGLDERSRGICTEEAA
ncbi:MAG: hypothetical protein OJF51_005053 [Nitrospira sp.]|nr:MAG: hypothetical protein OJF51_005053 [Nitrospira sp.]